MVWRVTNEPVDYRPSRGTNKHTHDNSTASADYDSAHANYTLNYIRQLQNHDYIHMTTAISTSLFTTRYILYVYMQVGWCYGKHARARKLTLWLSHELRSWKQHGKVSLRKTG